MASFLDIILLLFVVVFIFNKIRNVLGTRPDNVETIKVAEQDTAKLFDIIMKEQEKHIESKIVIDEENLNDIDKVLLQIPNFNKEKFIQSAQKAFEVISSSFAKGDFKTLEMLVNKTLYKKFFEVIEQRKEKEVFAETDFIAFDKSEIVNASISKAEVAKIKMEFITQQVNLLKNKTGDVIEGDERFIQKITDIWTFEKAIHSNNPNWVLVSTKK